LLEDTNSHRHVRLPADNSLNTDVHLVEDDTEALVMLQMDLVLVLRAHIFVFKRLIIPVESLDELSFQTQCFRLKTHFTDRNRDEALTELFLCHPNVVVIISIQIVIKLAG